MLLPTKAPTSNSAAVVAIRQLRRRISVIHRIFMTGSQSFEERNTRNCLSVISSDVQQRQLYRLSNLNKGYFQEFSNVSWPSKDVLRIQVTYRNLSITWADSYLGVVSDQSTGRSPVLDPHDSVDPPHSVNLYSRLGSRGFHDHSS